jgi:hypothetical protein
MSAEIAIMQPTYLPWIGYFAMIDRVDRFVYLDSVQFAKRSWQQRNRIKTANGELMLSVPVLSKGKREQTIAEAQIDWGGGFAEKYARSIEHAYRSAPHFAEHFEPLKAKLSEQAPSLADYTIGLIDFLCGRFGITTPRERSSSLRAEGQKAELLAAICKELSAGRYLSAPGSREYIEESDAFERAGVVVNYHEYTHPAYPQGAGDFLPYMAAIDLLFHCGSEAGLRIIRQGVSRNQ